MTENEEFEFRRRFEMESAGGNKPAPAQPQGYTLKQAAKDFMTIPRGVYRGVQDVTDTLVKGGASLADMVTGGNARQSVDRSAQANQQNYQQDYGDSTLAGVSRVGGNILATAPVGGGLSKGVELLASATPKVAAALAPIAQMLPNQLTGGASAVLNATKNAPTAAAPLVQALRTSGMSAGGATGAKGLATRAAGGYGTGYTAASLIDPEDAQMGGTIGAALPMAGPIVRGAGNVAAKVVGQTTGAGDAALQQALRAGRAGGETAETFTKNMRGSADMTDVLDVAKSNLAKMNADKQAAYRSDMNALKTDKTVLAFDGIDNSVKNALDKVTFKGQVKNEGAANYLGKAQDEINNWKSLDPAEFHTPEGLDALKQKVGDILESIPFEQKTARAAVGDVYNGIKTEIKTQAPKYADTMKAYQEASELTKEIERALSLGNRASADTSMRKLQSLMRNNVNTNYGNRLDLAGKLEAAGGQEIMPAIAGQSLNSWTPRSIQGLAASSPAMIGSYAFGGMPGVIANAALTSPRLAGEAAYGLGKMTRPNVMANALRQGVTRGAPVIAAQQDQ